MLAKRQRLPWIAAPFVVSQLCCFGLEFGGGNERSESFDCYSRAGCGCLCRSDSRVHRGRAIQVVAIWWHAISVGGARVRSIFQASEEPDCKHNCAETEWG